MSFHVAGWVSLVMLMLILKYMLLLVLVVISILKMLTIQTFDWRRVFETMNWNKVSGKVTRWWTVWSQSCEILKLLPVFWRFSRSLWHPSAFFAGVHSSYLPQPPQPRSVGLFRPVLAQTGHFVANFGVLFTGLNGAVVYQNWQICGMQIGPEFLL